MLGEVEAEGKKFVERRNLLKETFRLRELMVKFSWIVKDSRRQRSEF